MLFRGGDRWWGATEARRKRGGEDWGPGARPPPTPSHSPPAWGIPYLKAASQPQLPARLCASPSVRQRQRGLDYAEAPEPEPGIREPSRPTGLPAPSPPRPQQALPVPVCCAPLSRTGVPPVRHGDGRPRCRPGRAPPQVYRSAGLGASAGAGRKEAGSPGPGKERSQLRVPAPPGPGDFPSLSLASSLLSGLASGPASRGRRESAEPSAWHSAIGSNRPTYWLLQMLHIVRIRECLARQEPRSVDMLFPFGARHSLWDLRSPARN